MDFICLNLPLVDEVTRKYYYNFHNIISFKRFSPCIKLKIARLFLINNISQNNIQIKEYHFLLTTLKTTIGRHSL